MGEITPAARGSRARPARGRPPAASHRFEPCSAMRRAMPGWRVDAGEGLAAAAVAFERDQRRRPRSASRRRSAPRPAGSKRLSQVVKIDSVSVCTPRYSLAPMSLSASSSASARPAAIAGRASGSVMSRASGQRLRAERARHLDQRRALGLEHRAGGEIDVRVEHEAHDQDRAAERADVRKPVVGGRLASRTARAAPSAPVRSRRACRRRRRRRCRSGTRAAAAAARRTRCGREIRRP